MTVLLKKKTFKKPTLICSGKIILLVTLSKTARRTHLLYDVDGFSL